MQRWVLVLAVAGLAGSCRDETAPARRRPDPHAVQPQDWPRYTSEACEFSVALPFARSPDPVPPGVLDQIATENASEQMAFVASCGEIPEVRSPEHFLEFSGQSIASQLGGTLLARTAIASAGMPGLELRMRVAADAKPSQIAWAGDLDYRVRLFVSGGRLYQLQVLHAAGIDAEERAQAFFASFTPERLPTPSAP